MTTYNDINVSRIENRKQNLGWPSKHDTKPNFKHDMKQNIKWMAILGLLLPITWLGSTSMRYTAADFERLQWLCSDYQLSVAGYVVEGWFQATQIPGMERFLSEQLSISSGLHRIELDDGSILTTSMQRKNSVWQIELQLIAKTPIQAMQYYRLWQNFADKFAPNHPVGITVVAELPEPLETDVANQVIYELAKGLALTPQSMIRAEQYQQLSGFTEQLQHTIHINGTPVNGSITIVPEAERTCLYIASPILYQQI
ncbi:MAG: hypothetical protein IIU56_03475 [Peptococcaceae bacterium]|nr:hypothetical protein [Peptococcaceae bacterium]